MTDILVLYTSRGVTRQIAERIAARLIELGHRAVAVRASERSLAAPDLDAVIVGAPAFFGRHRRTISDYILTNRRELAEMATAYFTIGGPVHRAYSQFAAAEERFFDDVAWKPGEVSELASSLRGRAFMWMRNMLRLDEDTAVASIAERLDDGVEPRFDRYVQDPNA